MRDCPHQIKQRGIKLVKNEASISTPKIIESLLAKIYMQTPCIRNELPPLSGWHFLSARHDFAARLIFYFI